MPPSPAPKNPEDRAAQNFSDELDAVAASIAAELGPAPGSRTVSDARAQALWWQRDPLVDRQLFLVTLQHQGLPPDKVAPLQVVAEHPEWAPLYMQRAPDPETAAILAAFAEFPYRPEIMLGFDDPTERVKMSERLTAKGPPEQHPRYGPAVVQSPPGAGAQPQPALPASPVTPSMVGG